MRILSFFVIAGALLAQEPAPAPKPELPEQLSHDILFTQRNALLVENKLKELLQQATAACDKAGKNFDATNVVCVPKSAPAVGGNGQ